MFNKKTPKRGAMRKQGASTSPPGAQNQTRDGSQNRDGAMPGGDGPSISPRS